jgi:uncharacterized protein (DUF1810 family)
LGYGSIAALEIEAPSLNAIFGSPDDMKFRSCVTSFALAATKTDNPFQSALDRWCDGRPDDGRLPSYAMNKALG